MGAGVVERDERAVGIGRPQHGGDAGLHVAAAARLDIGATLKHPDRRLDPDLLEVRSPARRGKRSKGLRPTVVISKRKLETFASRSRARARSGRRRSAAHPSSVTPGRSRSARSSPRTSCRGRSVDQRLAVHRVHHGATHAHVAQRPRRGVEHEVHRVVSTAGRAPSRPAPGAAGRSRRATAARRRCRARGSRARSRPRSRRARMRKITVCERGGDPRNRRGSRPGTSLRWSSGRTRRARCRWVHAVALADLGDARGRTIQPWLNAQSLCRKPEFASFSTMRTVIGSAPALPSRSRAGRDRGCPSPGRARDRTRTSRRPRSRRRSSCAR